jgi:Zn-dependent peptidase ImmA (M78 family)/transcriptional regulator with XRE-family HTH domain
MSPLNPKTVEKLRESRGLSRAQLAGRARISTTQLDSLMSKPDAAKIASVQGLAGALGVDEFVLYHRPDHVPVWEVPDFRREDRGNSALAAKTYRAIDAAQALRSTAARVATEAGHSRIRRIRKDAAPASAAESARSVLGLDFEAQVEAKTINTFYADFRFRVEADNIFVLQDSFPIEDGAGFSLSDGTEPAVIVVNTKSATIGRRIFTLAHELFHVIRGESGVSSPFSPTPIERQCDQFAAELLLPAAQFVRFVRGNFPRAQSFLDLIPRIASKVKLSQQAVALRLEELKLEVGIYRMWMRRFSGPLNPDLIKKGGGAGGRDERKIKLAKFGTHFAEVFASAIERGAITFLGLYELSGLKRDYADSYFAYAREVRRSGLRENVFEDED